MARPLDDIDRQILAELQRDSRLSGRALAERISISRAAAYARVERLNADGVIAGYGVRVEPARLGLQTSAYVALSVHQSNWRDLRGRLSKIPEVRHMALTAGDFDVMLLVRTTDNDALKRTVLDKLQAIPYILGTRTYLIFEDHDN